MKKILIITTLLAIAGGMFYFTFKEPVLIPEPVGDTQKFFGGATYTISGSGISSTATSIGLTSLTIPQNGYPIQDSDLSDIFYMTIEPGSNSRQEFVSCTTVGSNTGGAVTLSGCVRGLSPISPYTASSTLQFSHSGGSKLIFSNSPNLYDQAAFKGNDESITGIWTFLTSAIPRLNSYTAPTNDSEFAPKKYVDDIAVAGAPDATETVKGNVELATKLETASSTAVGGTGANLAIRSLYSTSTPDGTSQAGLYVPVSKNNGKLHQLWLDLTEAFTWTGTHIFGGSTTLNGLFTANATSTMATTTTTDLTVTGSLTTTGASVTGIDGLYATSTVFTATGTWTKPVGASRVEVFIMGGGGGGGGGSRAATAAGGGGGGGGALVYKAYLASSLSSSESVVIGTGGTAGTAQSGTGNGGNGGNGVNSTFSSAGNLITGNAGSGGQGGQGGTGGTAGAGGTVSAADTIDSYLLAGGAGGAGGSGAANGAAAASLTTLPASSRGGGGGGGSADSNQSGGAGGTNTHTTFHAVYGFQVKPGGLNIFNYLLALVGGAGGSSAGSGGGTAGTGVTPTAYGGGGGGGGAKDTDDGGGPQTSGAGGAGASGFALIITYF